MLERLERDLVGPGDARRRSATFRWRSTSAGSSTRVRRIRSIPAQDDDVAEGEDEATYADPPVALANEKYPSSAGMTFAVDLARAKRDHGHAHGRAVHPRGERGGQGVEASRAADRAGDAACRRTDARSRICARRRPGAVRAGPAGRRGWCGGRDAGARQHAHRANRASETPTRSSSRRFVAEAADGEPAFVERNVGRPVEIDDADLRSYRLLYRDARTFAAGHGCSVDWDAEAGATHAVAGRDDFRPAPCLAARRQQSGHSLRGAVVPAACRGSQGRARARAARARSTSTARGSARRQSTARELPPDLREIATEHLELCRATLDRIRDGILVLDDPVAWEAFRLANRAMWNQRARAGLAAGGEADARTRTWSGSYEWRPFQLAFILLCLRGIVDPDHADREIADLLWFPTGGGKTEAYLGLIAFTVFLRRLRSDARRRRDGAHALHAAAADDPAVRARGAADRLLRADSPTMTSGSASTPISIGLWVGKGGTPNTLAEARTAIDRLRNDQRSTRRTRSSSTRARGAARRSAPGTTRSRPIRRRMRIRCRDESCAFRAACRSSSSTRTSTGTGRR